MRVRVYNVLLYSIRTVVYRQKNPPRANARVYVYRHEILRLNITCTGKSAYIHISRSKVAYGSYKCNNIFQYGTYAYIRAVYNLYLYIPVPENILLLLLLLRSTYTSIHTSTTPVSNIYSSLYTFLLLLCYYMT